jgi:hypothetical protein
MFARHRRRWRPRRRGTRGFCNRLDCRPSSQLHSEIVERKPGAGLRADDCSDTVKLGAWASQLELTGGRPNANGPARQRATVAATSQGSLLTRRWRKADSNRRSRPANGGRRRPGTDTTHRDFVRIPRRGEQDLARGPRRDKIRFNSYRDGKAVPRLLARREARLVRRAAVSSSRVALESSPRFRATPLAKRRTSRSGEPGGRRRSGPSGAGSRRRSSLITRIRLMGGLRRSVWH